MKENRLSLTNGGLHPKYSSQYHEYRKCSESQSHHCCTQSVTKYKDFATKEREKMFQSIVSSEMTSNGGLSFNVGNYSAVDSKMKSLENCIPTPPDSPLPAPELNFGDLVSPYTTLLGQRNLLKVPTSNTTNFFVTRRFCYIAYCTKMKCNFNYANISVKSVMKDSRVQQSIDEIVIGELEDTGLDVGADGKMYTKLIDKQTKRAKRIVKDMRSALSSHLIRLTGYVLFKVFNYLFKSVCVNEGQLQMIEAASKRDVPIIFLPLHRSHVDYLFVTWVLFNREIPAPLVAAGDNLRMPVFGWLLRGLGGFFIRRRLESSKSRRDCMYRSILQTYMTKSLSGGFNLEFFIEGGRTRTGKPCMPKGGLLSVIIDAHINGSLEDALIVPIAINYDKILDGNFIREQLGQNKVPESFWRACCAILKVLSTSFGHSRIDFSQPFSLREFFSNSSKFMPRDSLFPVPPAPATDNQYSAYNGHLYPNPNKCGPESTCVTDDAKVKLHQTRSNSSLFGTEVTDDYRLFVKSLAHHIVYDAEKCQAIMSTNAIAWLLSFSFRDGTTLDVLTESLKSLRADLFSRGRDCGFQGTDRDITIHALDLLSPNVVTIEGNLHTDSMQDVAISPIATLPAVIELNYYSNALMPIYALDAIIATSLVTLADCDLWSYKDVNTNVLLPYTKLVERCRRLCSILQNEFIFVPPCGSLDSKIYDSFDRLVLCGLVTREGADHDRRFVRNTFIDEDSDSSGEAQETYYYLTPSETSLHKISSWTRALIPLIDAYFATISNLTSLVGVTVTDKEYVNQTQVFVADLMEKRTILYGESICADPIRNCMKYLESEKVIESHTHDSTKVIYLSKRFENESVLHKFVNEIQCYRV